ncbi:MAG: flavodoxin [Ruminococcus flavefaciens]|nr:flavodoxin [Ruminococcus flavefaciens]
MKKMCLCLSLILCFFLAGCTVQEPPTQASALPPEVIVEEQNILIAYFTWAENTHVEDPDAVDVNATTSASVLLPGNTGRLAAWIQQYVGGDLFKIITEEPYSSDYDECLNRAIQEHDSGTRPKLTATVENMDDYDVIFLGFPNWWYSCPMAILTFVESYDLSGKVIVPFCAHGTGGFAASLRDIGNSLPSDCTVLDALGVYRPNVATAESTVLEWLTKLGFMDGAEQ